MKINISSDPEYRDKFDKKLLRHAINTALQHESIQSKSELSIVITGDERIKLLNRDYLGEDRTTDVLSFPAGEEDPATGYAYLGDILVSFPQAEIQASRAGYSTIDEIIVLIVHGFLHLLGYDHAEAHEKALMWTAQTDILTKINVNPLAINFLKENPS